MTYVNVIDWSAAIVATAIAAIPVAILVLRFIHEPWCAYQDRRHKQRMLMTRTLHAVFSRSTGDPNYGLLHPAFVRMLEECGGEIEIHESDFEDKPHRTVQVTEHPERKSYIIGFLPKP